MACPECTPIAPLDAFAARERLVDAAKRLYDRLPQHADRPATQHAYYDAVDALEEIGKIINARRRG